MTGIKVLFPARLDLTALTLSRTAEPAVCAATFLFVFGFCLAVQNGSVVISRLTRSPAPSLSWEGNSGMPRLGSCGAVPGLPRAVTKRGEQP